MTARGGLMEIAGGQHELLEQLEEIVSGPREPAQGTAAGWPPALNGITAPAKTWAHPATIARGVARLQRDYPGWSVWVSSTGRIWAASPVSQHRHRGSGQTLDADNPRLMRVWLEFISEQPGAA